MPNKRYSMSVERINNMPNIKKEISKENIKLPNTIINSKSYGPPGSIPKEENYSALKQFNNGQSLPDGNFVQIHNRELNTDEVHAFG